MKALYYILMLLSQIVLSTNYEGHEDLTYSQYFNAEQYNFKNYIKEMEGFYDYCLGQTPSNEQPNIIEVEDNNDDEETLSSRRYNKEKQSSRIKNKPEIVKKRKKREPNNQYRKMTMEIFEEMLEFERDNSNAKRQDIEKHFNINRSTYWRWKNANPELTKKYLPKWRPTEPKN